MALGWMGAMMALASVVKNPNSSCSPSTCALFGARTPRHLVQRPAKANSGRSSLTANQVGVLRGVVGAYSQNDVAGTRHRFLAESQPRQCGLATLRMLVTGWPPNCGGPRMPQRARPSSRSPSALLRTIGASWSGKIPGDAGRLPVLSCAVRNKARMAAWPLVSEYRFTSCRASLSFDSGPAVNRFWPRHAAARARAASRAAVCAQGPAGRRLHFWEHQSLADD